MQKSRKNSSVVWSIPSDDFKELVKNSSNIAQILRHFNLVNKGGNSNTVKRRIKYENINMSHIVLGKGSNKGKRFKPRKSNDEFFCKDSNSNGNHIKRRIIRNNLIEYKCSECSLTDTWKNKKLVLQLEHKNGNRRDNRLENLTFLCPNCHSQTDTFAGKNRKFRG